MAEVELLDDLYPAEGAAQRAALQRRLFDRFRALVLHLERQTQKW
jgi:hypothetical protein